LAFGHTRLYHRLGVQLEDAGFSIKDCLCWGYATGLPRGLDVSRLVDKEARGCPMGTSDPQSLNHKHWVVGSHISPRHWSVTGNYESHEPVDEEAKKWQGWKTTMKPAWEPIIMAQKPLEGTYVNNILKWHVGALNIDACRIPHEANDKHKGNKKIHPKGRWPANLLWLDPLFDDYDRFFMVPKPSKKEKREYNTHETVKPIRLMENLVKLVSPKPATVAEPVIVFDPFMGSGSTGKACKQLHRYFIGYESDSDFFEIALKRLKERSQAAIFEGNL